MRTVVFVCSGNTCRSPMAEAIARHSLREPDGSLNPEVLVVSAGLHAGQGVAVTPETVHALKQRDIEHSGSSKPLTAEMIRKADAVYTMTDQHVEGARELVADEPEQQAKIARLDPDEDIEDPIGMGQEAYDAVAERMLRVIPKRLEEMLAK